MKKKSLVTLALSLSAVAVIGLGSTLAYFNKDTNTVTNTFTVGQGYGDNDLTLNEAALKETQSGINWEADPDKPRVENNTYSNLMPNSHIDKDPMVHLGTNVNSYVFVRVDGVDEADTAGLKISDPTNIGLKKEWKQVEPEGTYDGYYVYTGTSSEEAIVTKGFDSTLFEEMYVNAAQMDTQEDLNALNNMQIKIQAVAIQADGIDADTAFRNVRDILDLENDSTTPEN